MWALIEILDYDFDLGTRDELVCLGTNYESLIKWANDNNDLFGRTQNKGDKKPRIFFVSNCEDVLTLKYEKDEYPVYLRIFQPRIVIE